MQHRIGLDRLKLLSLDTVQLLIELKIQFSLVTFHTGEGRKIMGAHGLWPWGYRQRAAEEFGEPE